MGEPTGAGVELDAVLKAVRERALLWRTCAVVSAIRAAASGGAPTFASWQAGWAEDQRCSQAHACVEAQIRAQFRAKEVSRG